MSNHLVGVLRGVKIMTEEYKGHFSYDKISINLIAPDSIGVYYMGIENPDGSLGVTYVGRALGTNVTVKGRLLDHLNNREWSEVVLFGFRVCTTQKETEDLEKAEIIRLKPIHNQRVG